MRESCNNLQGFLFVLFYHLKPLRYFTEGVASPSLNLPTDFFLLQKKSAKRLGKINSRVYFPMVCLVNVCLPAVFGHGYIVKK